MGILDLIFPKSCLNCGKPPARSLQARSANGAERAYGPEEGGYICSDCVSRVRLLKPACPYCEKASIDGFTHSKCKKKYGLDGLISVWDYEGVIRKAIMALKYKYSTEVGKELTKVFMNALKSRYTIYNILNTATLVPIPLHWHRENVRGFNQSEEIGKLVAKEMEWNFNSDLLVKKKSTIPQATLSVEKRKKNLHGVFVLSPSYIPHTIPNILLFDDVFTTGSTLKEAAKVLKRAGVAKVWGLTIAR